jgi:hypothetical protein
VSQLGEEVKEELNRISQTVLPFSKTEVRTTKAKYVKLRGKNKADLDVRNHIEHKIFVLIYKIKRAAYHGGNFNGVHCRKILGEGDDILDDIKEYLKSVDHVEKKATDEEIETVCDSIKRVLQQLNIVFSILRMKHGTPKEEDYTKLEAAIKQAAKLWEELDMSCTPKFHLILVHALSLMRKHNGFGDMLEDDLEKSHQDMDRIHRRLAGLGSCAKRSEAISRKMKTQSTPAVVAITDDVNQGSKRKMSGPSKGVARKEKAQKIRHVKRDADLEKEKSTPAGPVINDFQTTKEEHKSTLLE